jgi:hypothetical protein
VRVRGEYVCLFVCACVCARVSACMYSLAVRMCARACVCVFTVCVQLVGGVTTSGVGVRGSTKIPHH